MIAYVSVAVGSFFVALSGAMIPGPMMLATVTSSRKHGYRAGPLISTAHAILEMLMVLALFFGAARLLTHERIIGGLSIVGAAVLAWMGGGAILYSRAATIDGAMHLPISRLISNPFIAGFATTAGNPTWWIWWPTVGLSWLAVVHEVGAAAVIPFYFGHISGDYLVYSVISAAVTGGRNIIRDKHFRYIIAGCGVFMICFAGYFAYEGLKRSI